MDIVELHKRMISMDLEYNNVIIDSVNTRMIRFKNSQGYCDLVRAVHWVKDVEHKDEMDKVLYMMLVWTGKCTCVGDVFLGHNYYNAKRKFMEILASDKDYILHCKQKYNVRW